MKTLKGGLCRYDISVRLNPERGGDVAQRVHAADLTTQDADALKLSSCRHILLLVHGFNDTAGDAATAYQQMIDLLVPDLVPMAQPDAIVCFQWPGDYAVGPLKQADAIGYPIDIERARQSAPVLLTYLRELWEMRGAGFRISIIAHSMGCRLILEMLHGSRAAPLPIAMVALMAAAVPVQLVEAGWSGTGGPYLADTGQMARAMLKFHSPDDWVLWLAFPAGESLAFAMQQEPAEFISAIGCLGDPTSFAQDGRECHHGHSEYWSDTDVAKMVVATLGAMVPRQLPRTAIPSRRLPPARAVAGRELASSLTVPG